MAHGLGQDTFDRYNQLTWDGTMPTYGLTFLLLLLCPTRNYNSTTTTVLLYCRCVWSSLYFSCTTSFIFFTTLALGPSGRPVVSYVPTIHTYLSQGDDLHRIWLASTLALTATGTENIETPGIHCRCNTYQVWFAVIRTPCLCCLARSCHCFNHSPPSALEKLTIA